MSNLRIRIRFKGNFLKQDKLTFIPRNVETFLIASKLNIWPRDLNTCFTLKDCLFGAVNLTKIFSLDKHYYSGYSIRFISRSLFSVPRFDIFKIENPGIKPHLLHLGNISRILQ